MSKGKGTVVRADVAPKGSATRVALQRRRGAREGVARNTADTAPRRDSADTRAQRHAPRSMPQHAKRM
jgi:hypothetical protein